MRLGEKGRLGFADFFRGSALPVSATPSEFSAWHSCDIFL